MGTLPWLVAQRNELMGLFPLQHSHCQPVPAGARPHSPHQRPRRVPHLPAAPELVPVHVGHVAFRVRYRQDGELAVQVGRQVGGGPAHVAAPVVPRQHQLRGQGQSGVGWG